MTQHDYVIDNQSFPATRTDLNNVLQAIVSNNSGTSAPSTTFANQIWYDSSANILYIRNEDNDANIPLLQFDQSADVAATLATVIDILDASGTNQAGTALTIRGGAGTGTGAGGSIILQTADGGSSGSSVNSHATVMTISDAGDVGIGTTPAAGVRLDMRSDASTNIADLRNANSAGFGLYVAGGTGSSYYALRAADKDNAALFTVLGNGNTLVGKTTNAIGTAGVTLQADGFFSATRSGSHCAGFNRLSDDGNITEFRQDGTLAGAIGSTNTIGVRNIFVAGTGNGLSFGNVTTYPVDENGAKADDSRDLGFSSGRFDDIFATNGTIQTSDQNEKQDIASLTSAEITAAKAISKLFKTFKWKSKVTSKGDNARTHTGIIAQEVQSAMSDAGLDATKYAFWCSDTWWEKDVEVPAVEAVDAVTETHTDKDGNKVEMVIKEAVEACDAYTRTDTYTTKDEAPEDATERTRLGVRYPELMAFVGAATEQRLADIETRLAALEG